MRVAATGTIYLEVRFLFAAECDAYLRRFPGSYGALRRQDGEERRGQSPPHAEGERYVVFPPVSCAFCGEQVSNGMDKANINKEIVS